MKNMLTTFTLVAALVMATGCSESESDPLYANCVSIEMKEQMVGWEESDRPSVKVGVQQGCKLLIKECDESPQGEMCNALRTKFNAKL
tara:strand:+ start:472 stop:735 length:264 start_codon:yes stop_codon:yes gene_type:complete